MKTSSTTPRFMKLLAPLWSAMRAVSAKRENIGRSFGVKQAGRALKRNEYETLENLNLTKGGGENVAIQFGLLGNFSGNGILGESPG